MNQAKEPAALSSIAEKHRERFEFAYATAWAKARAGGETAEQLAAEIQTWRVGDTYGADLPRLRFGWEGYQWATLALHSAPPAPEQLGVRDLEREALRACSELPDGWEIEVQLERGYGVVVLIDPDGNDTELPVDGTLVDALKESIDTAIRDDAARAATGATQ